jgi:hypothetical protein
MRVSAFGGGLLDKLVEAWMVARDCPYQGMLFWVGKVESRRYRDGGIVV